LDIVWGIGNEAKPFGEVEDAAELALEGAKLGIKLKARKDLEKAQNTPKVGDAPENDADDKWKNFNDVGGKKSLDQNALDPITPGKREKSLD
jgi:hypothetical protein